MLSSVAGPLRTIVQSLVRGDGLRQLAGGFALGLAVTLAPQGHLIAVSLCVLLFSLRVNRGFEASVAGPIHLPTASPKEATSCAA